MTRWQAQQAQAKREGYKNAWARRKALGQATYVPQQGPRRKPGMQPEWTTPLQPRTRLERLAGGHGPVRQLVADGKPLNSRGQAALLRSVGEIK